jgi:hypothetical protein
MGGPATKRIEAGGGTSLRDFDGGTQKTYQRMIEAMTRRSAACSRRSTSTA